MPNDFNVGNAVKQLIWTGVVIRWRPNCIRQRKLHRPRQPQIMLLGKLIFYDRQLSVKRNESCSFCHMPETGFTGPVSALNQTTVAYPGSIRTRFSGRKPQSHSYASYAPVLHYNAEQGDFVGGQFWDM